MSSLTVSEAKTRADSISVGSYDVHLDLTRGDAEFLSRTTIQFESRGRQDTWVDVQPATLTSVRLNGTALDVGALADGRLQLSGLQEHNVLDVEAMMAYSHDGEGLHRAVDAEDKQAYVYAMTFLPAAPRVFASFDQPDLKAIFRVTVSVPRGWIVLGNGRATEVGPGEWELAETKPLATYFATLVAGPYHSITAEHDGIELGLHCRQSLAAHLDKDAEELFDVTSQCFDEYHRLFAIRYPFGDYHQVFCPDFNAGAMENPGCVTFTDSLVFKAQATDMLRATRAYVVAHEMAHQWFGNLVTMTWWDDLWLNESFAEYMGYRVAHDVTSFKSGWAEFAYARKAWGMAADQRSSTHPVAGNGARDTDQALSDFDGISYTKGAAVLRQLNSYLGDEAFLAGVVDHLTRHSYGNARLDDLLDSWSTASDKDVRAWASAWLRTSGVDTLSCVLSPDGQPLIEKANGSSEDVSRPHAIHVTWFGSGGRTETTPLLVTDAVTPVPLAYDGAGLVLPDSADETWAKLLLDDVSIAQAPQTLGSIDDPLARAVVWGALRESLLDGVLDPERYLVVAEQALPGESDLGVEAVLPATIARYGTFLADPSRRERLATVAWRILVEAEPASNRQLVAARAWIAASHDADTITSWLDGAAPDGLVTDEDLRWRLTRQLCEVGAYGLDDVASEQDRDPSSEGAIHALECRAALPDPATKSEVWRTLTTADSLGNYELFALAEYFFRPAQGELTEPYVARFFHDVPATARIRTGWLVERLAELAFPRFAVSTTTVELAEQCLAGGDLTSGARRAISDRTDDLRRALRSRSSFDR